MTSVGNRTSFGHVEIFPATKEEMPVLANLFELYAHDFSEFYAIEPGPDGRFGYPDLPRYWSEAGRFPFLIRVGERLAGFVLVHKISQTSEGEVWDVAEFFVLRAYRRRGVGKEAAFRVWRRLPGILAGAGDGFESTGVSLLAARYRRIRWRGDEFDFR